MSTRAAFRTGPSSNLSPSEESRPRGLRGLTGLSQDTARPSLRGGRESEARRPPLHSLFPAQRPPLSRRPLGLTPSQRSRRCVTPPNACGAGFRARGAALGTIRAHSSEMTWQGEQPVSGRGSIKNPPSAPTHLVVEGTVHRPCWEPSRARCLGWNRKGVGVTP